MFEWRSLALPYLLLRDCGNSSCTMNVTSVAMIFDDDDDVDDDFGRLG